MYDLLKFVDTIYEEIEEAGLMNKFKSDQINYFISCKSQMIGNINSFLRVVKKALDKDQVSVWKEKLYSLYINQKYEIKNTVGNVAFEKLLEIEPHLSRELIGHKSVAPYLKYFLGKQCQLRSLRAHINPGTYLQEWHMDFYDYWYQQESSQANVPLKGLCMNTKFYLTDNTPEKGRLRFLTEFLDKPTPENLRSHAHYTDDRKNLFQT